MLKRQVLQLCGRCGRVVLSCVALRLVVLRLWPSVAWLDGAMVEMGFQEVFRREVLYQWTLGWLKARFLYPRLARDVLVAGRAQSADYLYFSPKTYPDLVSEALALNEALAEGGVLVTLGTDRMGGPSCAEVFRQVFDVRGNLYLLGRLLGELRYKLAVVRNTGGTFWALPIFLALVRTPFVYRPSGFINQMTDEVHRCHLGDLSEAAQRLERAVLGRTALVIHNHDAAAIKSLERTLGVRASRYVPVRPGLHPTLVARQTRYDWRPREEISIVYCGGYAPPGSYISSNVDYLAYWKLLADSGIHVHVYYSHTPRNSPRLAPVRDLLDGHPRFHLYDPVPVLRLFEEVQQYDFVWAYFKHSVDYVRPEFRRFVSANTCVAMGAGLPAVVNEHYEPLYSTVRQYGNGLALPSGLEAELPALLKAADRVALRQAAAACREQFYFPGGPVAEAVRSVVTGVAWAGKDS
ncbi:MAG: hypothetical protein HYS12_17625 [Planctomycetes bacterium]|nr:hypothetical protein [Planctomycetota bacterium]MBI3457035.1 hypothetical protein [Candidatus Rokubacteria bacterium]